MFEVLVFVYENFYAGEDYPEPAHLHRKLSAVGFNPEEIQDALAWLQDLSTAARGSTPTAPIDTSPPQPWLRQASADSQRIYPAHEWSHLGTPALGFLSFLENEGLLPPYMREVVIDRAMAAPGGPVSLEDLKVIVLMVYWSFGQEPSALLLDELCHHDEQRIAH